tara:strand:- start:3014 stop:3340 length:327 start_codon:yes stop_codon:yes gene_type:complete
MEKEVSVNLKNTKFKLTERSRGRMKIQIKFSKEEAEGFKNFCMIKPEELADEMFYKQIFFAGCNTMTEQIQAMMKERSEELEKEEASAKKEEPTSITEEVITDDSSKE